jgi:crotonobetainyl-CoA:carnitine CoA-transferase CaiB-like acyl-CoA transferase
MTPCTRTHLSGTRSTWMDLTRRDYVAKAHELLGSADVVVENFRGRKIANFGLSAEEVAQIRPGIIYASLIAFGWEGRGVSGASSSYLGMVVALSM